MLYHRSQCLEIISESRNSTSFRQHNKQVLQNNFGWQSCKGYSFCERPASLRSGELAKNERSIGRKGPLGVKFSYFE